jgi:hypothetical protein
MSHFSLNKIPDGPGVYALYEGDRTVLVGSAPGLRSLAETHLFGGAGPSREASELIPHPERITEISWWQHPAMEERDRRRAARWIAIETLAPANRPRFTLSSIAEVALQDPEFVKSMSALFRGPPAGSLVPQSIHELARSVYELKHKVSELERRLAEKN